MATSTIPKSLASDVNELKSSSTSTISSDITSGQITLIRSGHNRVLKFSDVVPSETAINLTTALEDGDKPSGLFNSVLWSVASGTARVWIRTNGTLGAQGLTAGSVYHGEIVYFTAS